MTNSLLSILLMAPSEGGQQNPASFFIMMILIVVVFYFFMIRPQQKRQKEIREYRKNLAKGDKVITVGGIYGKISEVSENYVKLDVGNNIVLKVDKNGLVKDSSDIQTEQKQ